MTEPVQDEVVFTLSSMPPLTAVFGLETATMVVGLEDQPDGSLKAYVGARWKGVYLSLVGEQDKDMFRRAWGSTSGHIWLSPLPPPELLWRDEPEEDSP